MRTAFELIHVTSNEGVAEITLDRPPLNVLTIEMIHELQTAVDQLSADKFLKALVVRATGKAFCAGVDVADHVPERVDEMIRGFSRLFISLQRFPAPTIAAVHGAALGGGTELAIGCDIVLAGASARFGQPEITLGVFPPIAAAYFPRLVGRQQAARLIFTGAAITADEARGLGLVTDVAPDADLWPRLEDTLARFRGMSAVALRLAKRALLAGVDAGGEAALATIEDLYLGDLMQTSDAHEGIRAFIEKRPPVWRNE